MIQSALITGASRGLGATLARFLAGCGATLLLTARDAQALKAQAETCRDLGAQQVIWRAGDLADTTHRFALAQAAEELGGLDLLVNNASTLKPLPLTPLCLTPPEVFREVLEVNVLAPLELIQLTLPLLRTRQGLIVQLSSDAAHAGYPGWGAYGASKAALELLSLSLAQELDGVSVVVVDPGDLRTQLHQEALPEEDPSQLPPPEVTLPFWAWLLSQDPLRLNGHRFEAQSTVWEAP